jgi:hypothetical protein
MVPSANEANGFPEAYVLPDQPHVHNELFQLADRARGDELTSFSGRRQSISPNLVAPSRSLGNVVRPRERQRLAIASYLFLCKTLVDSTGL